MLPQWLHYTTPHSMIKKQKLKNEETMAKVEITASQLDATILEDGTVKDSVN